jgi:hypothetical protein
MESTLRHGSRHGPTPSNAYATTPAITICISPASPPMLPTGQLTPAGSTRWDDFAALNRPRGRPRISTHFGAGMTTSRKRLRRSHSKPKTELLTPSNRWLHRIDHHTSGPSATMKAHSSCWKKSRTRRSRVSKRSSAGRRRHSYARRNWHAPGATVPNGEDCYALLAPSHGRAVDSVRSLNSRRFRECREPERSPTAVSDLQHEVWDLAVAGQVSTAMGGLPIEERRELTGAAATSQYVSSSLTVRATIQVAFQRPDAHRGERGGQNAGYEHPAGPAQTRRSEVIEVVPLSWRRLRR